MYEAMDGTSFQTNWRCKLHNQILKSNGRSTIQKNIKLLKQNPKKVGGDKEPAKKLIELLEIVSEDQSWLIAKAMAGLSVKEALEVLNSMKANKEW